MGRFRSVRVDSKVKVAVLATLGESPHFPPNHWTCQGLTSNFHSLGIVVSFYNLPGGGSTSLFEQYIFPNTRNVSMEALSEAHHSFLLVWVL